ncbi:unnamed protein product, partial [Acanthoscelides obtectus]
MLKDGSHLSWRNQPSFLEIFPELLLVIVTRRQQMNFFSSAILVTLNRCLDSISEIRLPALLNEFLCKLASSMLFLIAS